MSMCGCVAAQEMKGRSRIQSTKSAKEHVAEVAVQALALRCSASMCWGMFFMVRGVPCSVWQGLPGVAGYSAGWPGRCKEGRA